MTARARLLLILTAMVGALLTAVGLATPSGAAPYANQPAIFVSTQNPSVGGTLTVTGTGFAGNEVVDLVMHSAGYDLGSVTTDSSGDFGTQVSLPSGVSGMHTIVATGRRSGATASVPVLIGAYTETGWGNGNGNTGTGSGNGNGSGNGGYTDTGSGNGNGANGTSAYGSNATGSQSNGGLAYTGVAVLGIGGVGIVLLVVGAALLVAGRRRKASV